MPIKMLFARQVLDPLGAPAVEVDLVTDVGLFRAAAPSKCAPLGAPPTPGDGQPDHLGWSVAADVASVNSVIGPELVRCGLEPTAQRDLDHLMLQLDGTEDCSKLGAAATLAVSLALAEAGAGRRGVPLHRHVSDLAGVPGLVLPVPRVTVLEGGVRGPPGLPYREYALLPTGASTFTEALRMATEIYGIVKEVVRDRYGVDRTYVGDGGGLAPPLCSHREAMLLLTDAIARSGYKGSVEIALDAGAPDFCKDGAYDLQFRSPHSRPQNYLSADQLAEEYLSDVRDFGVCSIEDAFDEDWAAWARLTGGSGCQVVAGELTRSSAARVQEAAERRACSAVALRVGECATVWQLAEAARAARAAGLALAVRGTGAAAAGLALGLGAGQVCGGAPARGECAAVYNYVLRVEEELGAQAKYAGRGFRAPTV